MITLQPIGRQVKILLVEDNPGDARLVQEILNEVRSDPSFFALEPELTHTEYLKSAQSILAREAFDLILLDLSLPDSQGLETVQQILKSAPNLPVVIMSGLDDQTLALNAVQAGAQDYLLKDRIDAHWLSRAIRYAIERKRIAEALRQANEKLQKTLAEIKTLSSLLPICAACKKIRDDKGYWQQVEVYIQEKAGVEFSHGICPDCKDQLYGEYYQDEA